MPIARNILYGLLLAACLPRLAPAQIADDPAAPLREAASRGQTARVAALLAKGLPVDAADSRGRTALMLAAQQGRAEAVRLLLGKGANPRARDKSGFTAWGLAKFSPSGHRSHEAALKALPQPARPRVAVNAGWTPVHLISSCFITAGELRSGIDKLSFDRFILERFQAEAVAPGRHEIEIVSATARGMNTSLQADGVAPPEAADADAVVNIQVQPGSGCTAGKDNLSLGIDVRVFRLRDRGLVLGKSISGGGIRGLRTMQVDNPAQYEPVFLHWIKPEAEPLYQAVVEALYRTDL
jgi:Ankyrin repeats (3 copies)